MRSLFLLKFRIIALSFLDATMEEDPLMEEQEDVGKCPIKCSTFFEEMHGRECTLEHLFRQATTTWAKAQVPEGTQVLV